MDSYTDLPHPVLILIRGLPGSGKTYLAMALGQAIGETAVVMLDPDAVDTGTQAYRDHVARQTADGVDPKLHLYRFSRAKAYAGIEARKVIVWNQPFTNLEIFRKMTAGLETYAAEHGTSLSTLVVEVEVDPATARTRVEQRKQTGGHGPSADTFARFVREYTTAAPDGYDVIVVRGDADTAVSVKAILDRLAELAH